MAARPLQIQYGFSAHQGTNVIPMDVGTLHPLPYGPLWTGLAINTMFYGGVLWILWFGMSLLLTMIRRKRGLCIKCAYDLKGAAHEVCPECGTEFRKTSPQ